MYSASVAIRWSTTAVWDFAAVCGSGDVSVLAAGEPVTWTRPRVGSRPARPDRFRKVSDVT